MLNKTALKNSLYDGFRQIMEDQAANAVNGDEQADPADIIANICERMSSVVSDAVEQYVKFGRYLVLLYLRSDARVFP